MNIYKLLDKELRKTGNIEVLDYTEYDEDYLCSIDLYDIGKEGEEAFFEEVDNLIKKLKENYAIEDKRWYEDSGHKAEARIWIR